MKPIVWTIAGSDSGGGAGIEADLLTFHDFQTHGCSVITALTAQNSCEVRAVQHTTPAQFKATLAALQDDLPAKALKLGMLGTQELMLILAEFLATYEGFVVCDPVMVSTSGQALFDPDHLACFVEKILPHVDLLTPNLPEAEILSSRTLKTPVAIEAAAQDLLDRGAQRILIKGGHQESDFAQDYWSDGRDPVWLTAPKVHHEHTHGSGCTLSAAITACIAQGYERLDPLVIAKAYVHQGIRLATAYGRGSGPVKHLGWPMRGEDFPWITTDSLSGCDRLQFPSCGPEPLGFYPIVDDVAWVERLLPLGVKTLQLRIKGITGKILETQIEKSVALAKHYDARLFINDHWELALRYGAYGVHLGHTDLPTADLTRLADQGIRLGVSTHCYAEVATALALRPSYLAIGPIYPTTSKVMAFAPQGVDNLQRWCNTLDTPLVAIGGISLERLPGVLQTGVDGVAVISAVTQSADPDLAAQHFLSIIAEHQHGKR